MPKDEKVEFLTKVRQICGIELKSNDADTFECLDYQMGIISQYYLHKDMCIDTFLCCLNDKNAINKQDMKRGNFSKQLPDDEDFTCKLKDTKTQLIVTNKRLFQMSNFDCIINYFQRNNFNDTTYELFNECGHSFQNYFNRQLVKLDHKPFIVIQKFVFILFFQTLLTFFKV